MILCCVKGRLRLSSVSGPWRNFTTSTASYKQLSQFSFARQLIEESQEYKPKIAQDAGKAVEFTQRIINNSKVSKPDVSFYDPSNSTLDTSRPNVEILKQIMNEAEDRMTKRFEQPSEQWKVNNNMDKTKWKKLRAQYSSSIERATISLVKANQDINVGDLVLIEDGNTDIFMIIALPKELGNVLYTFVNHEGEIIHAPKSRILVRFPGVIPPELMKITDSLLILEEKFYNIAPIGVPDGQFSKSKQSLPKELRPQNLTLTEKQGVSDGENVNSSETGSDFIVSQASSQLLTNTDVNTYVIPLAARKLFSKSLSQLSIKIFTELPIIQQKLSILQKLLQLDENRDLVESSKTLSMFQILKLLEIVDEKNVNFKKLTEDYVNLFNVDTEASSLGKLVPNNEQWSTFAEDEYPIARFCALVLSILMNGKSWKLIQKNSSKVPITVDLLPINESYDKTLNFLKHCQGTAIFCDYVSSYVKSKETAVIPPFYDEIIQLLKDYISDNFSNEPVIETAVVNIIRSTDRILTEQLGMKPVVEYSFEYSKNRAFELLQVLDAFKPESHGWENPSSWSKSLRLPGNRVLVMADLSEDYYRIIDEAFAESNTKKISETTNRSTDRALVYEGSTDLTLFDDEVRVDVDLLSDKNSLKLLSSDFYDEDPYQTVRQPFGNTPVYCIDAPTAHEIDDGISIHTEQQQYVFTVHVANPTSYLKPDSIINRIALYRGMTNYFSEGPTMMFPKIMATIAGLEPSGEEKRTFAVQFRVDKHHLDEYIASGTLPKISHIEKQLEESVEIKLYLVNNLALGFTYERVNEVLKHTEKDTPTAEETIAATNTEGTNTITEQKNTQQQHQQQQQEHVCRENIEAGHKHNLKKLYHMAKIIQHIRMVQGSGIELSSSSTKSVVSVDYVEATAETDGEPQFCKNNKEMQLVVANNRQEKVRPVISIISNSQQDSKSKSQLLVSQFMIMANYLCTKFADKHAIGIIYRNQEMNLHDNVVSQLNAISQSRFINNEELTLEEFTNIVSVLTSATNQAVKKKHQSMGLDGYATVTSPLRRYMDMVNHMKFEHFLLKKTQPESRPLINDHQLEFIGNHLQNRELISRKFSKFSNKFWQSIFLKQYFDLQPRLSPQQRIRFELLPRTNPKFGDVRGTLVNFEHLDVKLETSAKLTDMFDNGDFRVGSVLLGEMELVKLDIIEDEVVLRLVTE